MRRAALLFVAAAATLSASSAHATIVISSDRGGLISDYAARFLSARDSGEQVVIDGACLSACTLVVGMAPDGRRHTGEQHRRQPGDAGRLSRRLAQMDRSARRAELEDDFPLRPRA